MKLYCGIDLHSNNSYIVIIDDNGKTVYDKRLANDMELILKELLPYQEALTGIVVESTYNWYWQVDGLEAAGYKVHLANTTAIKQYAGIKKTDDKSDACWLATMLRLEILAEGYIYPKESRGLREIIRRRMILVRQQTMNILGIQGIITRYANKKLTSRMIKTMALKEDEGFITHVNDVEVQLAIRGQLKILKCILEEVIRYEEQILSKLKVNKAYQQLMRMPGVGKILAMVILLETGEITRFDKVGNYSSYCRCVESKRISNAKKKGENNRKNGNRYLGWAFIEASNVAIRTYPEVKKYYQRKLSKSHRVVALKAIANKLSRAAYFVLRDGVEFEMKKLFS